MANKMKVHLIKDDKTGSFYLLGPGLLKEEVKGNVDEAWKKLEAQFEDNLAYYKSAGLAEEVHSFNVKKAFEKNFWLESALKGVIMTVPMLIGFILFSFALTNQISKLTTKIKDLVNPYDQKALKSQMGFKQTMERYRPYIFEAIKVWEEEKKKAEQELKRK